MSKGILAFGLCFLLICSTFIPISVGFNIKVSDIEKPSMIQNNGNTLYVGGNGPGNYSTINKAYNNANPGDTIFVYSGTYYEYLWIKKTINLIGEDKDTTSIIYNHKSIDPILIEAPDVVISGFTVYNPNPDLVNYIRIRHEGNHVSISNCIFYNNPLHFDDGTVGIGIGNSSHNRISNCTFLYNDDEGICLNFGSSHNIVENCVFSNCCMGIEFQNSTHNFINNCIMKDGIYGIAITVEDLTSNNNIITNCQIYNNKEYGIYLNNAFNNVIYNCSLNNNLGGGISVLGRYSYNNLIVNNKISNSNMWEDGGGLLLGWSCHNNTFSNNYISNYYNGVYIDNTFNTDDCNDNLFYHNNFIDNTKSAFDECTNFWDNGYPCGGNYWSDYTGIDDDGDGIGDTPYDISGPGNNKDYYPLMESWITDELTTHAFGLYYGLINVPLQFYGLAVGGFKPYSWFWDFGNGDVSEEQNPIYTYTGAGNYIVTLTVIDNSGNSTSDITSAWIQETNTPPSIPLINGLPSGIVNTNYNYNFMSQDLEGTENVWYHIEWGDNTKTSKWIGPCRSGEEITKSHSWYRKGTYLIRAKAKDVYGDESNWGEFEIKISNPRTRTHWLKFFDIFSILQRLLDFIK